MKILITRADAEGLVAQMHSKELLTAEMGVSVDGDGNFVLGADFTGPGIVPVEGVEMVIAVKPAEPPAPAKTAGKKGADAAPDAATPPPDSAPPAAADAAPDAAAKSGK